MKRLVVQAKTTKSMKVPLTFPGSPCLHPASRCCPFPNNAIVESIAGIADFFSLVVAAPLPLSGHPQDCVNTRTVPRFWPLYLKSIWLAALILSAGFNYFYPLRPCLSAFISCIFGIPSLSVFLRYLQYSCGDAYLHINACPCSFYFLTTYGKRDGFHAFLTFLARRKIKSHRAD